MTRVRGQPTPPSATMVPYRDSFARLGGRVTSGRAPAAGTRGRLPGIYTKARRPGAAEVCHALDAWATVPAYAQPFSTQPFDSTLSVNAAQSEEASRLRTCAKCSAHGRYTAARVARSEGRRRRVRRLRLALRGPTGCEDLDTNGHADHLHRDRKIGRAPHRSLLPEVPPMDGCARTGAWHLVGCAGRNVS